MHCRNILIVEDDLDILDALQSLLTDEGYTVFTASNGKEGLEKLKTIEVPCLVLLDLMMPVMNGWEFLEAKKSDVVIATIPVIIVSALRAASALGYEATPTIKSPVGYLKKPVGLEQLLTLVQEYCHPSSESTRSVSGPVSR